MQLFLQWLLIGSIILIMYNYFLYPIVIYLWSKNHHDPHLDKMIDDADKPSVSMIIAAYNEEKVIGKKIINSLALDYPPDKFQLIVVSDGSDDRTHEIVRSYEQDSVVAIFQPERQGKSAALNHGLQNATGDIIVFSDANNYFSKDAITRLVRHFSDKNVGAVTGAKHIIQNKHRESSTGDGLYWKYEAIIKKAESSLGSITGAEGEILAVRRELMKPIDPSNINDDAAITFDLVKSGYRVLYEEGARSEEEASIDILDDINVKIRMTAGGFQTLGNEAAFLFPPTNRFAFFFLSHKILRWLTPHFMIIAFISNLLLLRDGSYFYLFFLQLSFYILALYGWLNRKSSELSKIFYLPMYFTTMNIALFYGFLAYLNGTQGVGWKKARR